MRRCNFRFSNCFFNFITFLLISQFSNVSYSFEPGRATNRLNSIEQMEPLPDYLTDEKEEKISTPETLKKKKLPKQMAQTQFFLKDVLFTGNTVYKNNELKQLFKEYLNKKISLSELEDIRLAITEKYIKSGYVNSGAIIPDQKITNGVITIKVIEGTLSKININGSGRLKQDYIIDRIWKNNDEVFNTEILQENFQILLTDPLIERMHGRIRPDVQLGEGILDIDVIRAKPYELNILVNNHRPQSTGSEQLQLDGKLYNLTGFGDNLYAYYSKTEGAYDIDSGFSIPLNSYDTRFKLFYGYTDTSIIEKPLSEADIESDYRYYELGISHPLLLTLDKKFIIEARLALRKSQTYLFGEGTPFSRGVEDDGVSKTTVLRLIQEYTERQTNTVFAIRSMLNLGIQAFDATENNNLPDSDFVSWVGQFQHARRFDNIKGQLILRGDIQLANRELLTMERIALGGANTIRGYRENTYVRDNGYWGSIEYHYPISGDPSNLKQNSLQLVPFYDAGNGWNKGEYDSNQFISSIGIGFIWQYRKVSANLFAAYALRNIKYSNDHNLQDDGIHFQLKANLF